VNHLRFTGELISDVESNCMSFMAQWRGCTQPRGSADAETAGDPAWL